MHYKFIVERSFIVFEKILNKIRNRKNNEIIADTKKEDFSEIKKENFNINIDKIDDVLKMEISDYITITDYVEKMKEIDEYNLLDLVCNSVLWNSKKQLVNKGTYYILSYDGRLYNIILNEEGLKLDERIKVDGITEEKVIRINSNNDYSFSSLKHDKTGSTFYTKFYDTNPIKMGCLELSESEAYLQIETLIKNLKLDERISYILNIEQLENILKDIKKKSIQIKK
jgi:hypothetical protein